jgi:hypothetical protein
VSGIDHKTLMWRLFVDVPNLWIGYFGRRRYRRCTCHELQPMTRFIVAVLTATLMLAGVMLSQATAAERTARPSTPRSPTLPFQRSERAQSVWASNACWSECGSYCTWGLAGCLERDAQGLCVKLTDTCDRYCQRNCRTSGGPLLTFDF